MKKLLFICFTTFVMASDEIPWVCLDDKPELLKEVQDAIYIDPILAKYNYQLAKDAHDVFEENGLAYWISFGTLLGAVRHKGIIPWDDDLDFGIFKKDEDKLLSLSGTFSKMGYQLVIDREELVGYKLEAKTCITLQDGSIVRPFIDLFTFEKKEDRYVLTLEKGRMLFPNAWFLADQLDTRQLYTFGELQLWGPTSLIDASKPLDKTEPRNFFTRCYGTTWQTTALYYFAHFNDQKKRYIWTLTERDLMPA